MYFVRFNTVKAHGRMLKMLRSLGNPFSSLNSHARSLIQILRNKVKELSERTRMSPILSQSMWLVSVSKWAPWYCTQNYLCSHRYIERGRSGGAKRSWCSVDSSLQGQRGGRRLIDQTSHSLGQQRNYIGLCPTIILEWGNTLHRIGF